VRRENFDTTHRKVDGIEMNIKFPYSLAIFAIIIEILIFEIVLMRARREKRSSCSRYSPAQFIITLAAGGALERQEEWRAGHQATAAKILAAHPVYVYIYLYTGCPILNNALRFFKNYYW